MKRIVPIFLLLAMLLTLAVFPTSATEPAAAAAPTVRAVQSAVNQGDATKNDIRFLATVSSLSGSALGMEIRATFSHNGKTCSVEYGAADGLESNTVYTSVLAEVNGEQKSVTAQELSGDDSAIAIYSAVLKGVPADTDVVFTLKAYLIDNGVKTESDAGVVTWKEGKLTSEFGVVYQENFNDVVLDATLPKPNVNSGLFVDESNEQVRNYNQSLQTTLGWKITSNKNWGNTQAKVCASNGQATLNGVATTFQLLDADCFKNAREFTIDADIKVTNVTSVLSIFFNHTTSVGYYAGSGQFIRIKSTNNKITMTPGYYARTAGDPNYQNANIISGTETQTEVGLGETFHFTLSVNRDLETVSVLINGKQILTLPTYFVGGGLELHIQDAEIVLDNLVVIADSAKQPLDGTVLFEEDFSNYQDGYKPYPASEKITGNTPAASVSNGVLIPAAEWSIYRFATEADLATAERYVLQMDVTTDNAGLFNLVFNSSNSHAYAVAKNGVAFLGTFNILQFRAIQPTGVYAANTNGPLMATLLTYDNATTPKAHRILGYVSADESASTPTGNRSYTFNFAMEVDKTAGKISLWIDGRLLGTVENSDTETLVYNGFGGMYFWIQSQNTENTVRVDNIRIVAGAYTDLPNS